MSSLHDIYEREKEEIRNAVYTDEEIDRALENDLDFEYYYTDAKAQYLKLQIDRRNIKRERERTLREIAARLNYDSFLEGEYDRTKEAVKKHWFENDNGTGEEFVLDKQGIYRSYKSNKAFIDYVKGQEQEIRRKKYIQSRQGFSFPSRPNNP